MLQQNTSPTVPPPQPQGLNTALARNIQALQERRRAEMDAATFEDRLSARVTAFTGSMLFVYVHLLILVAWILVNTGVVGIIPAFDKSFVILATAASVEAIFLSTFVLISQNRSAAAADRRADLDLQINLLAEHEVTRLISLTSQIAEKLGVSDQAFSEIAELERDVAPEAVLDSLEQQERAS